MHHASVSQSSPSSVLRFPMLTSLLTRSLHYLYIIFAWYGRSLLHSVHHLHYFIALLAFSVVVLLLGLAAAFLGFFLAAALLVLGAPQFLVLVARLQLSSDQFMPMLQSAMNSVKLCRFCMNHFESFTGELVLSGHPCSTKAATANKQSQDPDAHLHLHHPQLAQTGTLGRQLPQWPCQCLHIQCLHATTAQQ